MYVLEWRHFVRRENSVSVNISVEDRSLELKLLKHFILLVFMCAGCVLAFFYLM